MFIGSVNYILSELSAFVCFWRDGWAVRVPRANEIIVLNLIQNQKFNLALCV